MANMYFAKLNINSKIYDLYEDKDKFNLILKQIYDNLDNKKSFIDIYKNEYKFNSITKYEDNVIVGRLSRIYNGEVESYDRKNDKPTYVKQPDLSTTSTFCFDVTKEYIAYTTPYNFGYKKFIEIFQNLLELYFDDIEFEIITVNNMEELRSKIDSLKKITEITVTLIPPNPPNKKEFEELFGDRADEIYESKATKLTEKIEVSTKDENGIQKGKFIANGYNAVEKRYGKMSVKGFEHSNLVTTISSATNAPLKQPVSDKQKNAIDYIFEKGKQFINSIFYQRRDT